MLATQPTLSLHTTPVSTGRLTLYGLDADAARPLLRLSRERVGEGGLTGAVQLASADGRWQIDVQAHGSAAEVELALQEIERAGLRLRRGR